MFMSTVNPLFEIGFSKIAKFKITVLLITF